MTDTFVSGDELALYKAGKIRNPLKKRAAKKRLEAAMMAYEEQHMTLFFVTFLELMSSLEGEDCLDEAN